MRHEKPIQLPRFALHQQTCISCGPMFKAISRQQSRLAQAPKVGHERIPRRHPMRAHPTATNIAPTSLDPHENSLVTAWSERRPYRETVSADYIYSFLHSLSLHLAAGLPSLQPIDPPIRTRFFLNPLRLPTYSQPRATQHQVDSRSPATSTRLPPPSQPFAQSSRTPLGPVMYPPCLLDSDDILEEVNMRGEK